MSTTAILPAPIQISPPTGTSQLPIVELNRQAVEAAHKPVRLRKGSRKRSQSHCSFGNFSGTLSVDAWQFFHAAKKTELTTSVTASAVDRRALCFAAEHEDFFVWNAGNLRRVDRNVFDLEDFSQSGLAGRFGEAIAYLTMLKWGYVYWDRIAVLWDRAAARSGMTHADRVKNAAVISSKISTGRPDLEPDFAFEKQNGDVALMESKGSFVHPVNDKVSTKDDLRHALRQLQAWSTMITPTPTKSYAIGTYFRDQSDISGDPSLITFVDPPGVSDETVVPADLPPDWIRRGNYGAWLFGMGYTESGNALRRGLEINLPVRQVPVVSIGDRDFAVALEGTTFKRNLKRRRPFFPAWLTGELFLDESWPQYPPGLMRSLGVSALRVIGIDIGVLKQIERSVQDSASQALLEHEFEDFATPARHKTDGFVGSILPDGTVYGDIDPDLLSGAREISVQL